MCRNNSIANRLGPFMTPLLFPEAILKAAALPVPWKNSGRFQSALINRISPELARYPSSYGFAFAKGPGLKSRMGEFVDMLRPPFVRPFVSELGRKLDSYKKRTDIAENNDWSFWNSSAGLAYTVRQEFLTGYGPTARFKTLDGLLARSLIRGASVSIN